jgi:HEAT repeat protein
MFATNEANSGHNSATALLQNSATLATTLLEAIDDEDARIRGVSVWGLGLATRWPNPLVNATLVSRLRREQDGGVRAAIVSVLGSHGWEAPDAQEVIVSALSDEDSRVQHIAALSIVKFHPVSALPRVVAGLRSADRQTTAALVQALASYGASAKPYIHDLEVLIPNMIAQGHGEDAEQVKHAVQLIQAAK